ncbi:putative epoxide hydrolase [Gordonia effusa NBRC 100432]|uniref:Putative epoxide hydrolase n=1 Tax=Gordonia effusa NBRC 100432 TaxID=1077974 RepID=H0R255_9ACTN|nr:alpha/beta hydrolase [Gordonia effusa]GAB19160.1 putative epoxide hydrolase [Gordonia effusa NBRC 100432]
MSIEQRTVQVGDFTFEVRIGTPDDAPKPKGKKKVYLPTVLLLHGFPHNRDCFNDVVPKLLDAGLRTVVFNQRGYSAGARPKGVENYLIEHLVSDVIGVLDALDLPHVLLVGHDWGGLVAWHVAAKYPQRLTGLVAVSTGHPSAITDALKSGEDQRNKSSYIPMFIAEGSEEKLLARDAVLLRRTVPADAIAPLQEPGALTAALNWYRANFTGDIGAKLACGPIEVPTTMIWSDGDEALGRAQAEMSGRYVYSDFRFCELTGVDHWVPEKAPAAVASEVSLRSSPF